MIRRGLTLVETLIVLAVIIVLIGLLVPANGTEFVVQIPTYLLCGWWWFLARVIPQVQPDFGEVAAAGVSFVIVLFGTHWFAKWLHEGWSWRWTFRAVGGFVLLFVCGTAAIGITHQTAWLLTTPEPMIERRTNYGERSTVTNNLKQLGLAADTFHEAYSTYPTPTFTPDGRPMHSWHTALLPFIEQDELFRKMHRDIPWNYSANAEVIQTVVKAYRNPHMQFRKDPPGVTHFAPNAVLFDRPHKMADFNKVGTSNTMLAADAASRPKLWADPLNWRDPALGLNRHPDGFGGGPWPNKRGLVVFLDGHVSMVSPEAWEKLRRGEPWED